jgi:small basic protein (TIGR04137 family)
MSVHPSLNISDKDKKQRSVLKRTERLRTMMEKGQWKEGDKVYGLPKIKTVRIKIKKEKVEKVEAALVTEGATPAATPGAKEQPAAKEPTAKATKESAAKSQDKK